MNDSPCESENSIPSKRSARWWKLSIRTLLVTVAGIAVGLGWYINRVNQQRDSVQWIEANGGEVEYDFDSQVLFSNRAVIRMGRLKHDDPWIDFQHSAKRVRIAARDPNKRRLLNGNALGIFERGEPEYDDHCPVKIPLERLSGLRNLEGLAVHGVGSASLQPLASMSQLVVLELSGPMVSDLSVLAQFKKLERLTITKSSVGNLAPISHCNQLEMVLVESDQAYQFGSFEGLKRLEYLCLMGGSVEDFSPLQDAVGLRRLILRDVTVSNWKTLAQLKQLQLLGIDDDTFDQPTLKKLRAALPNTSVR